MAKPGRKKEYDNLITSTFLVEKKMYKKFQKICFDNNLKVSHVTRILIDAYINHANDDAFNPDAKAYELSKALVPSIK